MFELQTIQTIHYCLYLTIRKTLVFRKVKLYIYTAKPCIY
nr:MAG TPA: hypothetical protein [Bacteriophage sp.]